MIAAYASIAALLKARSGLCIGGDKLYLLQTRLAPILEREHLPDLRALAARLARSSSLERDVIEAMTTNETSFFRDGKPFETLRKAVLPRLHRARRPGCPLRIWSAAAATGQEAYSIAMTTAEMASSMPGRPIEIIATDIAQESLKRARSGLFSQFEVQRGLSVQMLLRHFTKEDTQWRAAQSLRNAIDFREWNLLGNLEPLGLFDVIFCRNVLLYFDLATKRQVIAGIARQLAADGVLLLGGSETLLGLSESFAPHPAEPGTNRQTALHIAQA